MFTLPDNPYDIIGVASNAQIPEIRSAYRKLVLKCHPDKVTDPAQKAVKAEEFHKIQKAYETLSDENERQKYDDMVRANELEKENAERRRQREREFTPGRTPPRSYDSDYGRSSPHYTVHINGDAAFKVRTAEPREPPSFSKSSTWGPSGSKSPYTSTKTAPRSFEDMNHYSSYDDLPPRDSRESRRSRKAPAHEEKSSSRHDEEKRSSRKKAEEEFEREQAKAKKREQEKREAKREAERLEFERKEKERRKEEKRRAEKIRDTERKRDSDEKRSRHKTPYVEEDVEPIIYTTTPSKLDKKSKSSSRSKEVPVVQIRETREPPQSERDLKQKTHLDYATSYLQASRSKVPGLNRAQTYHSYHVRSASPPPPPPAVATPPPAANGMAPPPPIPSMAETMYEDDDEPVRRSSARRRMSHESPKVKEKTSSHKKSSSAREAEEQSRPVPRQSKSATVPASHTHQGTPPVSGSPPKLGRSQTEYVRPIPGHLSRNATWAASGDEVRDRGRKAQYYSEEESEDDVRHRRSRRTRSPEESANVFSTRYTVANGRTKAAGRSTSYRDESPMGRRSTKQGYYTAEANTGRPLEHRPAMHSYESYSSQHFPRVKTARAYDTEDVVYSNIPYSSREPNYGYA